MRLSTARWIATLSVARLGFLNALDERVTRLVNLVYNLAVEANGALIGGIVAASDASGSR